MFRIRLAERSLRCFGTGVLGLVPVLGLPLAVISILVGQSILRHPKKLWNPGRPYARYGVLLGIGSIGWQIAWVVYAVLG